MPYKDKSKQKEANRLAKERFLAKKQGILGYSVDSDLKTGIPKKEQGILRGRDITKFEHLPLDVQESIDRISEGDEVVKANRTAVAISYQHQFPGRYYH